MDCSIRVFQSLFITQPPANRHQLLEHFANCIRVCDHYCSFPDIVTAGASRKEVDRGHQCVPRDPADTQGIDEQKRITWTSGHYCIGYCQRYSCSWSSMLRFLSGFVSEVGSSIEFRRLSAECIGMIARTEGDNFTSELSKSLIGLVCVLALQLTLCSYERPRKVALVQGVPSPLDVYLDTLEECALPTFYRPLSPY